MNNEADYCHSVLSAASRPLYDRFSSYRLMPCLPTDFNYVSETKSGNGMIVKATMPAGGGQSYILRLVFAQENGNMKFDLPATFRRGMGENWQNKIEVSEQLYILMRQNMGDKLTCDMLSNLVKP